MNNPLRHRTRWMGAAVLLASACFVSAAGAAGPQAGSAQALLATHRQLSGQLARSSFGRPVLLESVETSDGLRGEIHAVLDHSLANLVAALDSPARWCELLRLHLNNRRCRVSVSQPGGGDLLTLSVVRRYDQSVKEAFELPFVYRRAGASPARFAVDMAAASGPLGTSNHRLLLEAVALGERKTFVRFSYAYEHHTVARVATQAYLATFGSDKVGFTVVGKEANGQPTYIGGLRGLVERNAMRYFFALDAYLAGAARPAPEQFERRLAHWFASIEKYPRQLHEVDLATYLELKRTDRQRDAAHPR